MKKIFSIITILMFLGWFCCKSNGFLPESKYVHIGNNNSEMTYLPSESIKKTTEECYGMNVIRDTFDMYNGMIKVVIKYPSDSQLQVSLVSLLEEHEDIVRKKLKISRYGAIITLEERVFWYGNDNTKVESLVTVNGDKILERGSILGGSIERKYGILYVHNLLNIDLDKMYTPLTIGYVTSPEQEEAYYHFFSNIEIITSSYYK